MDQDETLRGGRPRPSPNCVKWGPSSPPLKGHSPLPPKKFGHICFGQMAGWIKMQLGTEIGLSPGHNVLDGHPAPPPSKGHSPQFLAHAYCGQTAVWIKIPLGREVGLSPSHIVLDGDPPPPPPKGHCHQIFGPCLLWTDGRPSQLLLSTCNSFWCVESWENSTLKG